LVVAMHFATQERGNVGWFDSLDQGFQVSSQYSGVESVLTDF